MNLKKIANFSQNDLLWRDKPNKHTQNVLPFIINFVQTNKLIGPILRKHWEIIQNELILQQVWPKPPILVLKRNKNLCDHLVHANFRSNNPQITELQMKTHNEQQGNFLSNPTNQLLPFKVKTIFRSTKFLILIPIQSHNTVVYTFITAETILVLHVMNTS